MNLHQHVVASSCSWETNSLAAMSHPLVSLQHTVLFSYTNASQKRKRICTTIQGELFSEKCTISHDDFWSKTAAMRSSVTWRHHNMLVTFNLPSRTFFHLLLKRKGWRPSTCSGMKSCLVSMPTTGALCI